MYASLSFNRLSSLAALTFTAALALMIYCRGFPADLAAWLRTISMTLTIWSAALVALVGWSGKLAPWRLLWWACPILNKLAFPDLNGTWKGKVQSNWPAIEALIEAAGAKTKKTAPDELAKIPLKEVDIEMRITASLFTFRIEALVAGVNGTSYSLTERIQKHEKRDCFELFYIYLQTTPEPAGTDESTHAGAARLDVDTKAWSLGGEYWTRRSWRSGMNTAGRINVARTSRGSWF